MIAPAEETKKKRGGCAQWFIGITVVILVIVLATALFGNGDDEDAESQGSSSTAEDQDRPPTVRERIEDCLSPWDGHHEGFEDQIRPLLNDEGSMETHETFFGVEPGAGGGSFSEVSIRMIYSAENALGGRVKSEAHGRLNFSTCEVTVLLTGLE